MNFIALKMLTGDRAKYLGLIFAIAFCTFLLENQTSIFASILNRTGSQILDVTDADVWVMDSKAEYFEQTKALKDTDLTRVRGVDGIQGAVKLCKGTPVARTADGRFVAGQTFYLFTLENVKQFGALKAIGVTNWRLTRMVLLQALTVGAIGFSVGTGMAATFFEITLRQIATRGLVLMWQNVALTGGCILLVIIIASLLSIRRVVVLEPAEVFRG